MEECHISLFAQSIRALAVDMVEKAQSGHPGAPLGLADFVALLFGRHLKHDPLDPFWPARDRFVLSAGHASALLYSTLFLDGYPYELDDLKQFRQLGSKTPGHPERDPERGVEVTTGPLGQGIANSVGMALASKLLAARFGKAWDYTVYCIGGDGCFMEGVSQEALSFAGHYGLDNLVLIYDYNEITLDGPKSQSCSEDSAAHFRAKGFSVFEVDGHDLDAMENLFNKLQNREKKPVVVLLKTIIGKGAPNKQGTADVHGAPLGKEELEATKEFHKIPKEPLFWYSEELKKKLKERGERLHQERLAWEKQEGVQEGKAFLLNPISTDLEGELSAINWKSPLSGRDASSKVLEQLADREENFFSLSADLSHSNKTLLKKHGIVTASDFSGRTIHAGVREFAMAAIVNGLVSCSVRAFGATFFCFSDYMRPAIRLAALSHLPSIFLFTHDSIALGEDGPTHQPIEHLASFRAMPNAVVLRPSDPHEVAMSWLFALSHRGATLLVLSRQAYPQVASKRLSLAEGVSRGGYAVYGSLEESVDLVLIASGSEVALAFAAAKELEQHSFSVRVVSMVSTQLFDCQKKEYQTRVLQGKKRISIEMGSTFGWSRYADASIGIDSFGVSAPEKEALSHFGFTKEKIVETILKWQ